MSHRLLGVVDFLRSTTAAGDGHVALAEQKRPSGVAGSVLTVVTLEAAVCLTAFERSVGVRASASVPEWCSTTARVERHS